MHPQRQIQKVHQNLILTRPLCNSSPPDFSTLLRTLTMYFKLSNNRAANLILFWKKSTLHVLIPSCTFIYFEGFAILHVYSIQHDYLIHKFQFTTYFTKFFEEFQNEPNEYLDRVISISIQRLSFL